MATIPDVCRTIGKMEGSYPVRAVAVANEILLPPDPFTRVVRKCRKYAEWEAKDILVFDAVAREAWNWDDAGGNLVRISETYPFRARSVSLALSEVFCRLDQIVAAK